MWSGGQPLQSLLDVRLAGRPDDALKEINKLYVFLDVLDLPEVKLSTLLVHAKIFRARREFVEGL